MTIPIPQYSNHYELKPQTPGRRPQLSQSLITDSIGSDVAETICQTVGQTTSQRLSSTSRSGIRTSWSSASSLTLRACSPPSTTSQTGANPSAPTSPIISPQPSTLKPAILSPETRALKSPTRSPPPSAHPRPSTLSGLDAHVHNVETTISLHTNPPSLKPQALIRAP